MEETYQPPVIIPPTIKRTCSFLLTRGVRQGQTCNKPVYRDSEYCALHTKKMEVYLTKIEKDSAVTEVSTKGMR